MPDRPVNPATDPTLAPGPARAATTTPATAPTGVQPAGPPPDAIGATMAASSQPAAPAAAGGALRPGIIVAETYQITRLLGQGGMGAVWEAKHLRLPDKRVVIKVLLHGATEPVALARFRREAEIASRLGHPNIVQVLDFNSLPDGAPFIVLELLQGESLASRLYGGKPTFEQALAIVSQVGSALAAAHREGIVHRDLKPDNIFLCPTELGGETRDVVKILDFGISKIRGAKTVLTQDAALIGTPQYMAPEQATGRNDDIDARTDVFAFGAIVFEMLAGRPPFLGDTLAAVIHAVVYAPTPSLHLLAPDVPPAVVAAVERALAKGRDERFPDVASFVKAVTARSVETAPTLAATAAMAAPRPAPPSGSTTLPLGRAPTVARAPATAPMAVATPAAPAPIATERVAPPRKFPIVPVLLGLAIVAGAGWFVANRGPQPAPAPVAAPTPSATTPPVTVKPAEPPPPVAVKPVDPEAAKPAEPAEPARSKTAEASRSRPEPAGKAEALPAAAASNLAEAEAALGAGKTTDAIRLAQHSLFAAKSSRAHGIIARARCAEGDLGNAKAALSQVAARDRAAVVKACSKLGVDIH